MQAALSGMNSRLSSIGGGVIGSSSDSRGGAGGARSILDRNPNRLRNTDMSLSAFGFLFSELVQYSQRSAKGVQDLERMLNLVGYRVGQRFLELLVARDKGGAKREIRLLQVLLYINTNVWKALFGKSADTLEKSSENDDEYMISDNDLLVNRFVSVPKEMSQLNTGAFVAGVMEAILDGSGFPARVTAHTVPIDGFPMRTTILIKFDPKVIEREKRMGDTK
ncbi:Trafficking protein particle complex subunit 31 [Blastocladiella emersonii ATCC 22665]|nr:Trafficking protein particle complex subunit 31 [Blastocladiella emersonii ATCC 22665]